MPRCPYPYCDAWFQSNKGLEIHKTKMHRSIDPITGIWVDDPFKPTTKAIKKAAEKNPLW